MPEPVAKGASIGQIADDLPQVPGWLDIVIRGINQIQGKTSDGASVLEDLLEWAAEGTGHSRPVKESEAMVYATAAG